MPDIHNNQSDFVRYYLKAPNIKSLKLNSEPIGWDDDDFKLKRDNKYKGIFFSYTNSLKFIGDARDYIENAYKIGGINTNLYLIKYILQDRDGVVKWVERYNALADFKTKKTENSILSINFNSNDLEALIKSHENDEFEIERKKSIKNENIDVEDLDDLGLIKIGIQGRNLVSISESTLILYTYNSISIPANTILWDFDFQYSIHPKYNTVKTHLISSGDTRFSEVLEENIISNNSTFLPQAENLFYDNTDTNTNLNKTITIKYDIEIHGNGFADGDGMGLSFQRLQWNDTTGVYDHISENIVFSQSSIVSFDNYSAKGEITLNNIAWDEGLMFLVTGFYKYYFSKLNIIVESVEDFSPSIDLSSVFVHDVAQRLMYILSGRKDAFYSKYFGRTELGYTEDGEGGLMGFISGLWVRKFKKGSKDYKSPIISLKNLITSLQAVYNIGVTIESNNLTQRLRFENLKYFYQDEVVVKLPNQITNVKRKTDANEFYSSIEIGYERSGDYEKAQGLDEPNTKTNWVTPIIKSSKKYSKISKVNGDETGLEIARRKPQLGYGTEDTKYDSYNWFLDLKRNEDNINGYELKEWNDRLQELPIGIYDASTFRSSFFTPLRMMMRHAPFFKSGLIPYTNKLIKYINTNKNKNLETHANLDWNLADDEPYSESGDILISKLDRAIFEPEIVTFNHPINNSLMDIILDTTTVKINGENEEIPNYYFKFEYINENGKVERGYLEDLNPKDKGTFTMKKANESLIL